MNALHAQEHIRQPLASAGFDCRHVEAHLKVLHATLPGVRDMRTIPAIHGRVRWPCVTLDEALDVAERATRAERNVYVGVATRRTAGLGEGEGGIGNLAASRAIWADVDFSTVSHPAPDYDLSRAWADPVAREELAIRLELLDLEPSLVVWSGGGAHLYLELAEPFDLTTPNRVATFERMTRGVTRKLGADMHSVDAARVLRLAGTVNFKRKGEPTPCRIRGW